METILQARQIKQILQYRYPFQLIDKVIAYNKNENLTAVKAVSIGEPYFSGHFPDFPIMPGVLIIEALAQSASLLMALNTMGWEEGKAIVSKENTNIGILGSVKINLLNPVFPGNLLSLYAKLDWTKAGGTSLEVRASVDDVTCAKGNIIVASIDKQNLLE